MLQNSLILPEIILDKEAIISANESEYWLENEDSVDMQTNRSIIRNISLVLDNLFKNYDRSQRPGQGGKLIIYQFIKILRLQISSKMHQNPIVYCKGFTTFTFILI